MKKIFFAAPIFVIFTPQLASALDLSLQPRFKTGVQYYEYEQDSLQSSAVQQGLPQNMTSKIKFKDWLPFVGGGVTLFVDRFLIDFDVQSSFDGQADSRFTNQNGLTAGGFVQTDSALNTDLQLDTDFDRMEWAVSAGFAVTENFVIFAGYKRAKTEFDSNFVGESGSMPPIPQFTGTLTGKVEQKFDYDGPFVGASYNFQVEQGFLEGAFSLNLAVAFMDGNVDLNFGNVLVNGQALPFDFQDLVEGQGSGSFSNLDGDTTGVSVGANWKGLTAINGLTYFAGVNGYRYKFDGNDSPDFEEIQVRLDFGLAYALDF